MCGMMHHLILYRKIKAQEKLEAETVAAQKEEIERKRRLAESLLTAATGH